jgi:hypothetical protein
MVSKQVSWERSGAERLVRGRTLAEARQRQAGQRLAARLRRSSQVRVELRRPDWTRTVLAHRVVPLARLVTMLAAKGTRGEVVVVEAHTGRVLFRWALPSSTGAA